jgi:hypothetical protein
MSKTAAIRGRCTGIEATLPRPPPLGGGLWGVKNHKKTPKKRFFLKFFLPEYQ